MACKKVPGTGEVARFPAETLGTHKDGMAMHGLQEWLYAVVCTKRIFEKARCLRRPLFSCAVELRGLFSTCAK
jgi:hypothetical protein